jgi:hypothetical protein
MGIRCRGYAYSRRLRLTDGDYQLMHVGTVTPVGPTWPMRIIRIIPVGRRALIVNPRRFDHIRRGLTYTAVKPAPNEVIIFPQLHI